MITKLQEDFLRPILRRAHYGRNRSSFPFLSGDTYRSLCDFSISDPIESFLKFLTVENLASPKKIFVRAYQGDDFAQLLQEISPKNLGRWSLFLHNSDKIPKLSSLEFLSSEFQKIYCVNWLGDIEGVIPIPIGLENFSYLRNGVPRDYRDPKVSFHERSIEVLTAFQDSTFPEERSKARIAASSLSNNLQIMKPVRPSEYRKLLHNSKFVLSPPGNGFDCHRTWEAIYCGAIPIVKRDFWPFQSFTLPVVIVNEWKDIASAIANFRPIPQLTPHRIAEIFLKELVCKND